MAEDIYRLIRHIYACIDNQRPLSRRSKVKIIGEFFDLGSVRDDRNGPESKAGQPQHL
ncbi:MAG: hypothetical protein ACHWZW_11855 [Spirulina sp.]